MVERYIAQHTLNTMHISDIRRNTHGFIHSQIKAL